MPSIPGRTSFTMASGWKRAPVMVMVTHLLSPPWSGVTSVMENSTSGPAR